METILNSDSGQRKKITGSHVCKLAQTSKRIDSGSALSLQSRPCPSELSQAYPRRPSLDQPISFNEALVPFVVHFATQPPDPYLITSYCLAISGWATSTTPHSTASDPSEVEALNCLEQGTQKLEEGDVEAAKVYLISQNLSNRRPTPADRLFTSAAWISNAPLVPSSILGSPITT